MHKTMLAIILCSTFALPARAYTISGGNITSVDSGGKSFHYSWRKKHWTFKTTDTTVVRVGNKTARWHSHTLAASTEARDDDRHDLFLVLTMSDLPTPSVKWLPEKTQMSQFSN